MDVRQLWYKTPFISPTDPRSIYPAFTSFPAKPFPSSRKTKTMADKMNPRVYDFVKITGQNVQLNREVTIPYGEMEIHPDQFVNGIPSLPEQWDGSVVGVTFEHLKLEYLNEIGVSIPSSQNSAFADAVIIWPALRVSLAASDDTFADRAAKYNGICLDLKTGKLEYYRMGKKTKPTGETTYFPVFFPTEQQQTHFDWAFDPKIRKQILESKNVRNVSFRIPYYFPTGLTVTATIPWIPNELYKELMDEQSKEAQIEAALARKRAQAKIAREKKKAEAEAAAATPAVPAPIPEVSQPSSPAPVAPPAEIPTTPVKKAPAKKAAKRPAEKDDPIKKEIVDEPADDVPAAKKPRKIAPKKVPTSEEIVETLNHTELAIAPAADAAFANVVAVAKPVIPKLLLQPSDPVPTGEQLLQHFLTKCESGFKWPNPFVNKKTVEELFLDKESGPEIRGCFVTMQHFGLVDAMTALIQKSVKVEEKPTIKVSEKDLF